MGFLLIASLRPEDRAHHEQFMSLLVRNPRRRWYRFDPPVELTPIEYFLRYDDLYRRSQVIEVSRARFLRYRNLGMFQDALFQVDAPVSRNGRTRNGQGEGPFTVSILFHRGFSLVHPNIIRFTER